MLEGAKLSRYEIRKKIGSGGMGEVYLASDEQLDRLVALKVLLPEFCCNQERVQRFKLEARAASALNHPNIITIHEIGEAEERIFIATEFVDGATLREKIESGELKLLDSIKIAEQIADALAVAHEAHIVHRDIKPENIMIRGDGYVKILDFGLAKATLFPETNSEDKTLKLVQTQAGMVMGSVRYMSPEQARGKEIDERSDIWSLGVVLYEMVTGKNPFDGETISDSLAAVIHVEPAPLEDTPVELHRIIRKALRKNVAERYQSIKDFSHDLEDLSSQIEHGSVEMQAYQDAVISKTSAYSRLETSENRTLIHHTISAENAAGEQRNNTRVSTAPRRRNLSFLPAIILGIVVVLAVGAWYFQPFTKTRVAPIFESAQISRITDNGKAGFPAISPDGKYVAFVNSEAGLRSLTVRQVATGSTVQVVPPTNLGFAPPTFSNDGNYIYYTLVDKAVGTLYQVPSLGGTPKKIILDVDSKVNFSPDGGRLVFRRHDPEKNTDAIVIANSDGTNPQTLITTTEANHENFFEVVWSPTGDKLMVSTADKIFNEKTISTRLITISLADKTISPFGDKSWLNINSLGWLKDGSGVFLMAKRTDEEQQQIWLLSYPGGEARQITNDSSGYVMMSYAPESNTIAALKSDVISSLWSLNPQTKEAVQITSESRDLLGANGLLQMPGGKLLLNKNEGTQINFWLMDEDGRNQTMVTGDGGGEINLQPVLTPDGRFIVFASNRTGNFHLWRMDADGKNPVQLTDAPDAIDMHPELLANGKTVIFERRFGDRMKSKLMKTTIDGGLSETVFPESQTYDAFPRVSRDGKMLAYTAQSFESKNLIFKSVLKISAIDGETFKTAAKELNQDFGWNYQWTSDHKKMIFINKQGVPNLFQTALDGSAPKPVTNYNSGTILNFNLSRDGKKLFFVRGIINSDLILIKNNEKTS